MANDPSDLLIDFTDVSSLPQIYIRLNEAINHPKTSLENLGQIVSEDAGLSARLLRLVNSSFYGFPSKIETITRAVFCVGVQQLRDLTLATSVLKVFEGIPEDFVTMESFWEHSIACGVAAKILATYRHETSVERFFVGGVLHDIGRLVMNTKIPEKVRQALCQSKLKGELLYESEREVIGFDHSAVGQALLKAWEMPLLVQEMAAYHHHPAGAKTFPAETALIHVADIIVHALQFGTSGERLVPPLDEKAWAGLGLQTTILSPVATQLERQVSEAIQSILPAPKI